MEKIWIKTEQMLEVLKGELHVVYGIRVYRNSCWRMVDARNINSTIAGGVNHLHNVLVVLRKTKNIYIF